MLQKTTNLAVFVSIVALAPGAVQPIGAQVAGATLSGTITDQQRGTLGGAGYVWPVPYTPGSNGAGNNALANPLVGNIQSTMRQSRSWYNALEMKFRKRFSRGFQAPVAYPGVRASTIRPAARPATLSNSTMSLNPGMPFA